MDELLAKAMPSTSHVEKVLAATAEIGKASGLETAAEIMEILAGDAKRVDGSEVRAAAASLRNSAARIRARSKEALAEYKPERKP